MRDANLLLTLMFGIALLAGEAGAIAQIPSSSNTMQSETPGRWGVLPKLTSRVYAVKYFSHDTVLVYDFAGPKVVERYFDASTGQLWREQTFEPMPDGRIRLTRAHYEYDGEVQPDGSVVFRCVRGGGFGRCREYFRYSLSGAGAPIIQFGQFRGAEVTISNVFEGIELSRGYVEQLQARNRAIREAQREQQDAFWRGALQLATVAAQSYVEANADQMRQQQELDRLARAAAAETEARREAQTQREAARSMGAGPETRSGQAEARTRRLEDEDQSRQELEQRQQNERDRRALQEREAQAARREQERQRQVAEAERTRVIDFKEAVVLCELAGPQAEFGNWRCEGPLQMNYVNFGQDNYAAAFALMDCSGFRELPRAGTYRAFGCGYGIHPNNPGAGRNVPEMLGVFVGGRRTFRCPRNISGACRSQ